MSASVILNTAESLASRIEEAVGTGKVFIGTPQATSIGSNTVSIFAFHFEVNRELRNEPTLRAPPVMEPATQAADRLDALPLDVHFLISVFRETGGGSPEANELTTLGLIVQRLHLSPTLSTERINGQLVRMSPEPYSMEDMSRIWSLFGQDIYRPSMVYLASPVMIEARDYPLGSPVLQRIQKAGVDGDPRRLGENTDGGSA